MKLFQEHERKGILNITPVWMNSFPFLKMERIQVVLFDDNYFPRLMYPPSGMIDQFFYKGIDFSGCCHLDVIFLRGSTIL